MTKTEILILIAIAGIVLSILFGIFDSKDGKAEKEESVFLPNGTEVQAYSIYRYGRKHYIYQAKGSDVTTENSVFNKNMQTEVHIHD